MLRQIFVAISLLVATSMVSAGEAARIVFVAGQAHIVEHAILLGDVVNEGDEIATGSDGYIYMKTIDNGFLILRPNSRAHITAYHIDDKNPANTRVKLELLSGVARSISGLGVKQARQNFRMNTPVAAIGVRGTDFTVFTDQDISRVTVISGGIVVSGFGGACLPEGGGPCEGAASKELFADNAGQLLQIQKGQLTPKLLRSNGISPDTIAPPHSDEPVNKTSSIGNAGLSPVVDLSLDPQKSSDLAAVGIPVAVVPPAVVIPPVVAPTPPPTPPTPPTPSAPVVTVPEIIWGRWQSYANLPANTDILAKLQTAGTNGYGQGFDVGPFVMARANGVQLVLPSSGQVSFGLQSAEAYLTISGQNPVAAAVQNAQLSLNFAQKSFNTSLTLSALGQQVNINALGSVTIQGELISNPIYSNVILKGYLAGTSGQQAGYLFNSLGTPAIGATGATLWNAK